MQKAGRRMDVANLIELLILAFGGGAAWATIRARLKSIEADVTDISTNHLPHIETALENLPCRNREDCPEVKSEIRNPKSEI